MKVKIKNIVFLPIIVSFLTIGCKKFLNINPSTSTVNPTKIKDFIEMLNNDSLGINFYLLADLYSDDILLKDNQINAGDYIYKRVYLWNNIIWNPSDQDLMYSASYSRILQMNIILDRINNTPISDTNNTIQNRMNITSEALINRAWLYFQLANIYGPSFNESTETTDLTVPLILQPNASELPSRANASQMFGQIISDLKNAVSNPYFYNTGANIIHPGKAAGYAMLARTYLYMNNYDSASLYADSALLINNNLIDYNSQYIQPTQLLDLSKNPEVILGRLSIDVNFYNTYALSFTIGNSLFDSLGINDQRYLMQFNTLANSNTYNTSTTQGTNTIVTDISLSVPEVLLIKAECLAREGDVLGASTILDRIRSNRIKTGLVPNRVYNISNILPFVLGERRRELFYHGGLRLFDLKRLNNDPLFKINLVRKNSADSIIATLNAGSPSYLFPFSDLIIYNNPNIIQNPR